MIGHAEMKIGNAIFMLADEYPPLDVLSPHTVGGSPVSLMVYVDDVDSFTQKALGEGLTVLRPIEDQFYGDRSGHFEDPFGHKWVFATHMEAVSPEEMQKRAAEKHGGQEQAL
jgi:PhnB protein